MHTYWHIILSNPNAEFIMSRRGELFSFMHKQMIARYNCDRVAVGMPLVTPYGVNEWRADLNPGYDSNLGQQIADGVDTFDPRPNNARITGMGAIEEGSLRLYNDIDRGVVGGVRLRYENGQDYGISVVADVAEAFGGDNRYANIHNAGHIRLGSMGNGGQGGVLSYTTTSVRDPIFFRWHSFLDTFYMRWKNSIGRYTDVELGFEDVTINQISTISQGGARNQLVTFTEFTDYRLDQNQVKSQAGEIITYERLNYEHFTFETRLTSRTAGRGIGRMFLIPAVGNYANIDASEVAVEVDKFLIEMVPGENVIRRDSNDAPTLAKPPPGLTDLQADLVRGISEEEFNHAHCGWPEHLAIPRGTAEGMPFNLVLIVTRLVAGDADRIEDWNRLSQTSWGWCGVRQGQGAAPDSRPYGFPFDRSTPLQDILGNRSNAASQLVTITYAD